MPSVAGILALRKELEMNEKAVVVSREIFCFVLSGLLEILGALLDHLPTEHNGKMAPNSL